MAKKRYTLLDMQQFAQSKGGRCLSNKYINYDTKLGWECEKGHQWYTCYSNLIRGCWCPECAGVKKNTLGQAQNLAKLKGGRCLSPEYINKQTRMLWECELGHQWLSSFGSIQNGKSWCPSCALEKKKLTLKDAHNIAKLKGGRCLSTEYVNSQTKMLWECNEKHQWSVSISNIRSGTWCPKCAGVKKNTLEQAQEFAISKNGKCLSEEYISNKNKLLWECENIHRWQTTFSHIKKGSWCPKCAESQRLTLQEAQSFAVSKGGRCLSTKYTNNNTRMLWECVKQHSWEANFNSIKQGTWCPECANINRIRYVYNKYTILDVRIFATSKGGECLSKKYVNCDTKMLWRCNDGHEWKRTFYSTKKSKYFCPKCAGTRKLTLLEVQEIAKLKEGKCLSDKYINNKTKMKWECVAGHQWEATYNTISSKYWCTICSKK